MVTFEELTACIRAAVMGAPMFPHSVIVTPNQMAVLMEHGEEPPEHARMVGLMTGMQLHTLEVDEPLPEWTLRVPVVDMRKVK